MYLKKRIYFKSLKKRESTQSWSTSDNLNDQSKNTYHVMYFIHMLIRYCISLFCYKTLIEVPYHLSTPGKWPLNSCTYISVYIWLKGICCAYWLRFRKPWMNIITLHDRTMGISQNGGKFQMHILSTLLLSLYLINTLISSIVLHVTWDPVTMCLFFVPGQNSGSYIPQSIESFEPIEVFL